jgi:phosphoglycerate dehydrogenase-like enzyme
VLVAFPLADQSVLARLSAACEVVQLPRFDQAGFVAALAEADGVILRPPAKMDADAFACAPRLKVVANIGAGLDHIDGDVARARNIPVIGGTGANANAVAEFIMSMILLTNRKIADAIQLFGSGRLDWATRNGQLRGKEVAATTLGIVGYGHIGSRLAAMASPGLGMRVVVYDPYVNVTASGPVAEVCGSLDELLSQAQTLSVSVPLTDETRHLIGARELDHMPADAVVISASRGGVVDEDALIAALRNGRLAGAALDVFEQEPPSSRRLAELAAVPGLVITPHIAGTSVQAGSALASAAVDGVLGVLGRGPG